MNTEIDDISYLKSKHNIADEFTKIKKTSTSISNIITVKLDNPIEQCIVRRNVLNEKDYKKMGLSNGKNT